MLCWTQKGKKGTQHFSSIPFPLGQRSTSCSAFILISGCNEEKCENFLHKEILYEDSLDLRVCTLKTFKSPSMKLKWSISWPCVVLGWCLEGHLQDLSVMLNDFLFIGTFRIRESFLASILKDPYFLLGYFLHHPLELAFDVVLLLSFVIPCFGGHRWKGSLEIQVVSHQVPSEYQWDPCALLPKREEDGIHLVSKAVLATVEVKKGRVKASQEFWLKGNRYNHWSRGKWRMEIAEKGETHGSWSYKSESRLRRSLCLQFLFILENWAFQSTSRSENTFWEKISIFWENPCFPRWLACLV